MCLTIVTMLLICHCRSVKCYECLFYSDNYIEYEINGDKNKTPSIKKYDNEINSYLKDVINNLKKSDIQN